MTPLTPEQVGLTPLFASLNPEQRSQILDRHRETDHQPDQVLVMEQDW